MSRIEYISQNFNRNYKSQITLDVLKADRFHFCPGGLVQEIESKIKKHLRGASVGRRHTHTNPSP